MSILERQKFLTRYSQLDNDYSEFKSVHQELSDYILSHRGRFLSSNRKIKRNTRQINNKARMACRTLQGGLMSGITSPARPWFELQVTDPGLNKFRPVKAWLVQVQKLMRDIFSQSNIYNSFHTLYGELSTFAIAPMGIYQDYDNVIHAQCYTVGSYRVASNEYGRVNVFYREYELTVDQLVKKWGLDKLSLTTQELFKRGQTETRRKILHVIEPNDNRDTMSVASWNKPFRSVYIEVDSNDPGELKLKSGFNEFPIICPRWDVVGEETYGTSCPAMDCLGDVKSLQLGERRSFQATDKMVDPPLQGPSGFSRYQDRGGVLPGEIIIGDDPRGNGLRSVYDVNFSIRDHEEKLRQIEERISEAFYEDLFMMLTRDTRSGITAREIVERHEEKLLMLGPVLERLHNELLDPVIDRTFNIMQEVGIVPPPPKELHNTELAVNYISVLAQAQKMTVTNSIDQFTGFVAGLAQHFPEAKHKIDPFGVVDVYAEAMSVDPTIVRSTEEAQAMADRERNMSTMMAMAQQAPGLAKAAKDVTEIDRDKLPTQSPI